MSHKCFISKQKRTIAIRKNILIFVLAIVFVSCNIGFFSERMISSAKDSSNDEMIKYYKVVKIEFGDTLEEISNQYMDESLYSDMNEYIKEIQFINHLNDDTIKSGEKIIIPYYSNEFK